MNIIENFGLDQYLSQITDSELAGQIEQIYKVYGEPILKMTTVVLAALLAASLIYAFFGLRLVRIWGMLIGIVIGFSCGTSAAILLGQDMNIILIAGGVTAAVLAILNLLLYRWSIFLTVLITPMIFLGITLGFFGVPTLIRVIIAVAAGLVLAVLTIKLYAPLGILVTAVLGALGASYSIVMGILIYKEELFTDWLQLAVFAVIAVLGFLVQFFMESARRKKKHIKKAKEIKGNVSAENDVETARSFIDDFEADDDIIPVSLDDEQEAPVQTAVKSVESDDDFTVISLDD